MNNLPAAVREQILASNREGPQQFWEKGWFKRVFEPGHLIPQQTAHPLFQPPKVPKLDKPEKVVDGSIPPVGLAAGRIVDYAKQRLFLARLVKTEDVVRHGALRKFREIVLQDVTATGLGTSLQKQCTRFVDDEALQTTFGTVFVKKATATLSKRATMLWNLHVWCIGSNLKSIFSLDESALFSYVTLLKESGRGATTGKQLLQSLTFLYHMVDANKAHLTSLMSARVKGLTDVMLADKRPLKQSVPLTSDIVFGLEQLMYKGLFMNHERVICGHLLYCIFACARFGDTVDMATLELCHAGGFYLVEGMSRKYKMSSAEKKQNFLPLVALGQGLFQLPWAPRWFAARSEAKFPSGASTLPGWSETEKCWMARPMTTGEACVYLREFISLTGKCEDPGIYSCHSAKATILSWASKSNIVDFETRRLLGHHLAQGAVSTLTYSRDEAVRLQSSVFKVLQLIKNGTFDPDLTRVQRLRAMLGVHDFPEHLIPEGEDECYQESEVAEWDMDIQDVAEVIEPEAQGAECLEVQSGETHDSIVMNIQSSILHYVASPHKLACGRELNESYCTLSKKVNFANYPSCKQCENAKLTVFLGARDSSPAPSRMAASPSLGSPPETFDDLPEALEAKLSVPEFSPGNLWRNPDEEDISG